MVRINRSAFIAVFVAAGFSQASAEVCLPSAQPAPTALLNAFRDNPSKTLLVDTPSLRLATTVSSIVAADTTMAPQVIALLAGLPAEQAGPIGEGLGQAVTACRQNYPGDQARVEAATLVQQALAASDNSFALASYNTAAQNIATAAVAAAAGGTLGTANNGGIPTGGPNPGGTIPTSFATRNTAPSLLGGVSFGSLSILPVSAR